MLLPLKTCIIALVLSVSFVSQSIQQACLGPLKPCGYKHAVLSCCPDFQCLTDICVPASASLVEQWINFVNELSKCINKEGKPNIYIIQLYTLSDHTKIALLFITTQVSFFGFVQVHNINTRLNSRTDFLGLPIKIHLAQPTQIIRRALRMTRSTVMIITTSCGVRGDTKRSRTSDIVNAHTKVLPTHMPKMHFRLAFLVVWEICTW